MKRILVLLSFLGLNFMFSQSWIKDYEYDYLEIIGITTDNNELVGVGEVNLDEYIQSGDVQCTEHLTGRRYWYFKMNSEGEVLNEYCYGDGISVFNRRYFRNIIKFEDKLLFNWKNFSSPPMSTGYEVLFNFNSGVNNHNSWYNEYSSFETKDIDSEFENNSNHWWVQFYTNMYEERGIYILNNYRTINNPNILVDESNLDVRFYDLNLNQEGNLELIVVTNSFGEGIYEKNPRGSLSLLKIELRYNPNSFELEYVDSKKFEYSFNGITFPHSDYFIDKFEILFSKQETGYTILNHKNFFIFDNVGNLLNEVQLENVPSEFIYSTKVIKYFYINNKFYVIRGGNTNSYTIDVFNESGENIWNRTLSSSTEPKSFCVTENGNNIYVLQYPTYGGLNKLIQYDLTNVLNIKRFDNNSINLYPIPTNDILNIDFKNYKSSELFNISGQSILKTDEKSLDLSKFNKGVYFLTIETINGIKTKGLKVLKE